MPQGHVFTRFHMISFLSFMSMSCGDMPNFKANDDKTRKDVASKEDDGADEPVMVGGAYLTCGYVQGNPATPDATIGCKIGRSSNRKKINIYGRYKVNWTVEKTQTALLGSPDIREVQDPANPWHVEIKYSDRSYMNQSISADLTDHDGKTVTYDKTLNRLNDEEYDIKNSHPTFNFMNLNGQVDVDSTENSERTLDPLAQAILSIFTNSMTSHHKKTQFAAVGSYSYQVFPSQTEHDAQFDQYYQNTVTRHYDRKALCDSAMSAKPSQKKSDTVVVKFAPESNQVLYRTGSTPCFVNYLEADVENRCWFVFMLDPDQKIRMHIAPWNSISDQQIRSTVTKYQCPSQ